MTRHLPFEGIENFRDFGGYAGRDGRLKERRLFRSAHHGGASERDLEQLAGLGLAMVLDLRRTNEREREPCRRWRGFAAEVIQNDIPEERDDEWLDFIRKSDLSPASFEAYMVDYYQTAPFWARYRDLYGRWFQALAETDGPFLVHCAAGKDRTGVLCALTHHIAGVSEADIVADYMLTNDEAQLTRRLPMAKRRILEACGREPTDAGAYAAMRVEPHYLEAALEGMRRRYGSVDGYLEAALGVDEARREAVRARLLA